MTELNPSDPVFGSTFGQNSETLFLTDKSDDIKYSTGAVSGPALNNKTLEAGEGNDHLFFSTAIGFYCLENSFVRTGNGDDSITFDNLAVGAPPVSLSLPTSLASKGSLIELGNGNDFIKWIYKPKFNWTTGFKYCFLDTRIDAGAGNDEIYIWNAANTYIDGGSGIDTVKLYGAESDWDITSTSNNDGTTQKIQLSYKPPKGVWSNEKKLLSFTRLKRLYLMEHMLSAPMEKSSII